MIIFLAILYKHYNLNRYELCDFDGQLKKDIETSLLKSKSAKEKVTREKQPKISKVLIEIVLEMILITKVFFSE